jgi:hypothetical protein
MFYILWFSPKKDLWNVNKLKLKLENWISLQPAPSKCEFLGVEATDFLHVNTTVET